MKAATDIKHGQRSKASADRLAGQAKFTHVRVGADVPQGIASKVAPGALVDDDSESVIDSDDASSYAGREAYEESVRNRPDNPDRPLNVPGEDAWKVGHGGAFGREAVKPGEQTSKVTPGGAENSALNAPVVKP